MRDADWHSLTSPLLPRCQVIGMHFMNPVPVMKLVEVITGRRTATQRADTRTRAERGALHSQPPSHSAPLIAAPAECCVCAGLQTDCSTLSSTVSLASAMGKTVSRSKDVPGFVANRLLMPYINEAVTALGEGVASRDDIDACMKLGCAMPMGPLQLADFIGLDTALAIMHTLHSELGDSKYRPAVLLKAYVDAGWLGKKSGRGFYEYSSEQKR